MRAAIGGLCLPACLVILTGCPGSAVTPIATPAQALPTAAAPPTASPVAARPLAEASPTAAPMPAAPGASTRDVVGIRVGPSPIDPERAAGIQANLDAGRDPWRADPVAAAMNDGLAHGFSLADRFVIAERAAGRATVHARHNGIGFDLTLIQPVKTGPGGAWLLTEVALAPEAGP